MRDAASRQDAMAKGAKCNECPLRDIGAYVPSVGPDKARVAVVGEAPGEYEQRRGEPFVGPSGQLVDRVCKHYGMERAELLLSNACLCRPPGNATPASTAIQACRPRLLSELAERGVEVAAALGNSASQSLLGKSGILKLRVGPGKESPYLEGLRVVPTIHPAACLRPKMAGLFVDFVTDFNKIGLNGEFPQWKMPEFIVSNGRRHAVELIRMLWNRKRLVVDIETAIEKDVHFDHPNNYDLLCIGVGYERDKVVVFSEEDCRDKFVLFALRRLFVNRVLGMHNGKSDCAGLYPTMGDIPLAFDTLIAHYCTDERAGAPVRGLGLLGQELLGFPDWKAWIKEYVTKEEGYRSVPREKLYPYNAVDCQATFYLWDHYEEVLDKNPELRRLHDFLVDASNEVKYIELNGMAVDREYLKELATEYYGRLQVLEAAIDERLDQRWGKTINPRSPKQVMSYFNFHGITIPDTREETVKLVLETLEKKGYSDHPATEFCRRLLRHRKEQKLFSTYITGIGKRMYRGRVFPTILLHGTTTGRPSSRNPNFFNIPRGSLIKNMFVPGNPKNVFVQADQKQSEGRVIAWLAQEDFLRDIFNDPTRDIFDEFMARLYGDVSHLNSEQKKDVRVRVKAYFYGLSYGRTAYSIAQEYRMPVRDAEKGMKDFFGVIPNVVNWRKEILATIHRGEDLITPFGRHRRFWLITDKNRKEVENEALAFKPQSISSDICLNGVIQLRREFSGHGIYIRNFVYDSILVECPPDAATDVETRLSEVLIAKGKEVVGDYVDFATDTAIGHRWGEV